MEEGLNLVYGTIDGANAEKSAATRRQLVAGAAATIGGLGLLGVVADQARATPGRGQDVQTILNIAATAEILATIVNTVGAERVSLDAVTARNVRAAAREELIHYRVLTRSLGAKPLTKRIWVPDAVFASPTGLLSTLEVGDQIFVNAYLIGVYAFGAAGQGDNAVVAAEFMGVEAVHRALARQSLGKLGNDRVFQKANRVERAPDAPNRGQEGFTDIRVAVTQLQAAGFGFGAKGAGPGAFYEFGEVAARTPDDPDLNIKTPDPLFA